MIERTSIKGEVAISKMVSVEDTGMCSDDVVKESVNFEFKLFDFSGIFEVVAFTREQDKELRLMIK